MATTVAAGSTTGPTLAEQTVNAVSMPLHTVMMELLKVPTGSIPPYPEMTELEAHQLLKVRQQLIDRQQLLETMKKTHAERHFGPITELPCTVTDGLYGLRMQRPRVETTAINVFSLTACTRGDCDSSSLDVTGSIRTTCPIQGLRLSCTVASL